MKGHNTILFLIQLPPPVHGVGIINKMVWEDINLLPGSNRELIELNFSERTAQLRRFGILKSFKFLKIWFRLLGVCLSKRFQFVYFSIVPTLPGFYRDLFFVILIKAFRIKPVYHIHLMGIGKASNNKIMRFLYSWTFSNSVIIHPSENVCQMEFKDLAIKNSIIFIQPNGIIDAGKPIPKNTEAGIRIIYISHLYKFKGLGILLDVFHDLVKDGHDVFLDIIGDRAEQVVHDELIEYTINPLTKERLIWHGLLTGDSKRTILGNSDIMAFTSLHDTFPLVILEAMQFSIPVIASDVGGIPEIIKDGESGLLFEAGNRKQLKEKLEKLITNPELRKSIGKQAAVRFENNFTSEHFHDGMQNIFRQVL